MLIKNIFSKNSAWVLGFAVAAIFATTFVSCGGSDTAGDTINNLNVPADVATSDFIAGLLSANGEVIITAPAFGGEDLVKLADDLVIPDGKVLNLNGHPVTIDDSKVLAVGGSLAGLKNEGQVRGDGKVVAFLDSELANIKLFAETPANVVQGSVVGAPSSDATGQKYLYSGVTGYAAADFPANVEVIIGNATLTAAGATTLTAASIKEVVGKLTLASTEAAADAVVFTVPEMKLKDVVTTGKAQFLGNASAIAIKGKFEIGPGVAVKAGSITGAVNVTAAYTAAAGSGDEATPITFALAGLTLTGADIAANVKVVDAAASTASSIYGAAITGSIKADSGKIVLSAGDAIIAGTDGLITVASGGGVDIGAADTTNAQLTVRTAGKLTLSGANGVKVAALATGKVAVRGTLEASTAYDALSWTTKNTVSIATLSVPASTALALAGDSGQTTAALTGTATIEGTLSLAANTELVVAAGGLIDLSAASGKISTAANTSIVTLLPLVAATAADGGGAAIKFGTGADAKSKGTDNAKGVGTGADGSGNDGTPAAGNLAFTFAGALDTDFTGVAASGGNAAAIAGQLQAATVTTDTLAGTNGKVQLLGVASSGITKISSFKAGS